MLCRIGDVEVWRILEINAPFLTPEELYPTAPTDVSNIVEQLVPGSLCRTSGRLILPVQGFLLKTPSHTILVDSCVGNHKTNPGTPDWHQRSDGRFMAALTAAGVTPSDVDYVLCTHLHIDHIGWNTQLADGRWVPTFPNARYLMPASDELMQRERRSPAYQESVLPILEAGQAELVDPGHRLGDHVSLIPTPGHTPGHVSVRIEGGARQAVITGDALHTTAQCWHPDWHFCFDAEPEQAVASRVELLEACVEHRAVVLGSHFTLPSLGAVRCEGAAFAWENFSCW